MMHDSMAWEQQKHILHVRPQESTSAADLTKHLTAKHCHERKSVTQRSDGCQCSIQPKMGSTAPHAALFDIANVTALVPNQLLLAHLDIAAEVFCGACILLG